MIRRKDIYDRQEACHFWLCLHHMCVIQQIVWAKIKCLVRESCEQEPYIYKD